MRRVHRQHESAASVSGACKFQHYPRPRHVSFADQSDKPATFAVGHSEGLGVESSTFNDQLAANVVIHDGGSMATKGVKERLL